MTHPVITTTKSSVMFAQRRFHMYSYLPRSRFASQCAKEILVSYLMNAFVLWQFFFFHFADGELHVENKFVNTDLSCVISLSLFLFFYCSCTL